MTDGENKTSGSLNPNDEQDLRDFQMELLEAERSRWEPRCVARAFCTAAAEEPFIFTMQAWINLDACESPFLLGRLPDADGAILSDFEAAFRAFGHTGTTPEACEAEELVALGWKLVRAIIAGFATRARLDPPEGCKLAHHNNGLGDWLPILTCLKSQLGFSLAEALALPVAQAFAIITTHRCNEGWSVASETYAQRDFAEAEEGA